MADVGSAASSSSSSPADPFTLTRDGLRDLLKQRLHKDYHRHADTLFDKELSGKGFKRVTLERLETSYGLSPGAAEKIIALRDKLLGGSQQSTSEKKDQGPRTKTKEAVLLAGCGSRVKTANLSAEALLKEGHSQMEFSGKELQLTEAKPASTL